ncbi:MAG: 2-oxoglutarate dehydrogenase E1 component, partial [Planctomycetota bacterium]
GTVHIVVNNQIGYTTSPEDSRSTPFCTDVAKGVQAPVFHVNGDDPLAAIRMIRLALDYRMQFQRDVVLDIVCYRRHGHNEGDEPSYTQPLLYKRIEPHPTVREQYQDFLVRASVLKRDDIKSYDEKVQHELKGSLDTVRLAAPPEIRLQPPADAREWLCSVPLVPHEQLASLMQQLLTWPEDFHAHPKVKQVLARRGEMLAGQQPVDFSTAETLAFATLVTAGTPIRLAGQDSGRGTFSQRHATLYDFESNRRYVPLNNLSPDQAWFVVVDSLLSEEAALGFEYGYSVARPESLCLWEAQFGDFCNGAQIQIDQFLAAGEAKWSQQSGLVLLLPHGYDGQGPEHSSARLERFLQLCAEQNMRVANPSSASSYYHLLRRQAFDADRKPLIVMTPKSLLRQKEAGSPASELSQVGFQPVKDDVAFAAGGRDPKKVKRVVACSGKVYYDLVEARGERDDVAIVRLELLYPFPVTPLADLRGKYGAASWVFCQEEPQNMGAWTFVRDQFEWSSKATRPAAASPATGSLQRHKQEQAELVKRALG